MNTKLTLRLNKEIIDKIKIYAATHRKSISKVTEFLYIQVLDSEKTSGYPSTVSKYKGILQDKIINEKDEITDYLQRKHA